MASSGRSRAEYSVPQYRVPQSFECRPAVRGRGMPVPSNPTEHSPLDYRPAVLGRVSPIALHYRERRIFACCVLRTPYCVLRTVYCTHSCIR